jgi:tetratricopeptide (TPR) repeat protein
VALVVILVSRPWRSEPKVSVAPEKPTLAVLFFGNNTGDSGLDDWKSNLCSMFITAIRQMSPQINVLSIDLIYYYLTELGLDKAKLYSSEDLRKIASLGKATHIMTGYLLKHGQNLRLAYDLKDAAEAQHLGSDYQDGSDFSQMVDDLAKKVLRDLSIPSQGIARTIKTESTLALQSYLGARDLEIRANLNKNPGEKEALFAPMLQKLQMAIEADPNFAAAHWGLGDYYEHRFVGSHKPEDFDLMKKNYELAYQLDPESAGANAGLGWAKYYEERLDDAYRYFVRAFELEPENPAINVNVGSFLCSIGLIEKGIYYFTRAIESGDKTISAYYRRARRYMDIGQWAAAADDAKKTMEMEPNNNSHHRFYVRILAMMKRFDEAERELAIAEKLEPGNLEIQFIRTYIYSAQGDKKNALPILEKAKTENLFWYIYFLSQNYALLGLNDEAIAIIREGIEKGFDKAHEYLYPYPVLNSRSYENLRDDPRFQEILKSQKEKHDHQLNKYRGL